MHSLSQINTKTEEGKLLMAALAILTTTVHQDKEPDTVVKLLDEFATKMYEGKNVCGVNLNWEIKEHHTDLSNVMVADECRYIGNKEECDKFITNFKPKDNATNQIS